MTFPLLAFLKTCDVIRVKKSQTYDLIFRLLPFGALVLYQLIKHLVGIAWVARNT